MAKQNELTIRYTDLELLVQGSKSITIHPQGEQLLMQLLELKEKVDKAIEDAKSILKVAIEEVDPDLTSISSDNVKVMHRVYGMKYSLDSNLIDQLDPKFVNRKVSYSPNTKEIDNEIGTNGSLPNGVIINDRNKTVSITLKKKK